MTAWAFANGANLALTQAGGLITYALVPVPATASYHLTGVNNQITFGASTILNVGTGVGRIISLPSQGGASTLVQSLGAFTPNGFVYADSSTTVTTTTAGAPNQIAALDGGGVPFPYTLTEGAGVVISYNNLDHTITFTLTSNETSGGTPAFNTVQLNGVTPNSLAYINATNFIVGLNLTDGANINITSGAGIVIVGLVADPVVDTISLTNTAGNQIAIGAPLGGTLTYLNVPIPSGPRQYTFQDPGSNANLVLAPNFFTVNGIAYATQSATIETTVAGTPGQVGGWGSGGGAPIPLDILNSSGISIITSPSAITFGLTGGIPLSFPTLQLTGVTWGGLAYVNESGWLTTLNLTAGANIVITNAPYTPAVTIALIANPSVNTIALTATTSQILFGTGTLTTLNVSAPGSSRTVNLGDTGGTSWVVQSASGTLTQYGVAFGDTTTTLSTTAPGVTQILAWPTAPGAPKPYTLVEGPGVIISPNDGASTITITLTSNETSGGTPAYNTVLGVTAHNITFPGPTEWRASRLAALPQQYQFRRGLEFDGGEQHPHHPSEHAAQHHH